MGTAPGTAPSAGLSLNTSSAWPLASAVVVVWDGSVLVVVGWSWSAFSRKLLPASDAFVPQPANTAVSASTIAIVEARTSDRGAADMRANGTDRLTWGWVSAPAHRRPDRARGSSLAADWSR